MHFRDFSSGYAVGNLNVLETTASNASIAVDDFYELQSRFGGTFPLILKIEAHHICAYPDSAQPADTLALPGSLMESLDLTDWDEQLIFVGKPSVLRHLVEWGLVPVAEEPVEG